MPTPMRQAIARHMTFSKQNIPHYYLTMRPDIGAALDAREEWNTGRAKEDRVSVNDLLVKAVALALAKHPEFNGFYQDGEFRPQGRINIGIAIALDDGLLAPAILDCQELGIDEIARRSRDLAARARGGKLKAEEYTAGTFTITNLGMYDVENFLAIIVPPQVGILAVGAVSLTPALLDGELVTERRVALSLSADHRATDGLEGALFLGEVVSCLKDPAKLFA
ncbi:MAG: dihydrolipoamide acetyltransferase family protein [Armatimonadota bacterium]